MTNSKDLDVRLQAIEAKRRRSKRSTVWLFASGLAAFVGTYLALNAAFEARTAKSLAENALAETHASLEEVIRERDTLVQEVESQAESALILDAAVVRRTVYVGDGSLTPDETTLVFSCRTTQEQLLNSSIDEAPLNHIFLGLQRISQVSGGLCGHTVFSALYLSEEADGVIASLEPFGFSEYNFGRDPERVNNSMRIAMNGRSALNDYDFLGRVGGVNFEAIVNLDGFDVDLDYDSEMPDGERAAITIDGRTHVIPLFDWELEPIVAFSDSSFTAVVSIFGDGPEFDRYRYIDYHPAFEDTHMGVRLLQADILLMDPWVFSEAPTATGSETYLAGEDVELPDDRRIELALEVLALLDEHYQSWVLTDTGETAEIRLNEGVVEIDLTPYFYFWIQDGTASVVEVEALTQRVRDNYPLLHQIAPFVFSAVDKTAQYSALFRGAKQIDPLDWESFRDEVTETVLLPPVQTPNQFHR